MKEAAKSNAGMALSFRARDLQWKQYGAEEIGGEGAAIRKLRDGETAILRFEFQSGIATMPPNCLAGAQSALGTSAATRSMLDGGYYSKKPAWVNPRGLFGGLW